MRGMLRAVGRRWLRFAHVVGTIQMIVVLSVIYWVVVPLIAIPFKLLADPFGHRRSRSVGWTLHPQTEDIAAAMRRQY